jgi:hypothetical protein
MTYPPSTNILSPSRQTSPAPTYTSTFSSSSSSSKSPNWPLEEKSSNTPAIKQTQPDHLDPHHPHYIPPPPPPPPPPHSTRQSSHRTWPRKRILIPYALALVFFLTTLWLTSIALGVQFFNIMHPSPSPAVQEINVYIDGRLWEGRTTTTGSSTSSTSSEVTMTTSTYTGRLHLAQTGAPDVDVGLKMKERRKTGFVTVVRTM